ncbi:MAG: ABC transporter ATP-binding protein [Thioalkalivibrionaceae bacterium]
MSTDSNAQARALDIRGLCKTYADGFRALDGVDLAMEDGSFFALLGPNGAGKSTTIGILTGLIRKTAGTVRVFGHDLDTDPRGVRRLLGVVPQEFNFNQFEPVGEIVVNQAGYYGITRHEAWRRAERLLGALGLWDKRRAQARELSGGMKRRLMIARALVHDPKLLILDEPTAGVDIELRRSMWDFLAETNRRGRSIILTTHYLEEAEQLCRDVAIIDDGRIIEHLPMNDLLSRLDTETLVLDLATAMLIENLPALSVPVRLRDPRRIEIDLVRGASLNQVIGELDRAGIEVASARAKSNRLEELFLRLTSKEAA